MYLFLDLDAFVIDTIFGFDENDSTTVEQYLDKVVLDENFSISGIRVGIPKEYHCPGMSETILNAWSYVADILEEGGAKVVEVR